ncbi:MAG: hypothetical protein CSB33_00670 [Desulfobacterales bacterium]|nr:MAG: hypothetical protein CSB33_00670 [Desulfobacterales bacterium]
MNSGLTGAHIQPRGHVQMMVRIAYMDKSLRRPRTTSGTGARPVFSRLDSETAKQYNCTIL